MSTYFSGSPCMTIKYDHKHWIAGHSTTQGFAPQRKSGGLFSRRCESFQFDNSDSNGT